ncbi:hypothetical protein [Nocardia sp. NPDC057440]|uniref:hypothetical protein n=1 Tax=Nocardia sp. NPDC057440 TaxID=3346134 RepID=UPI00366CF2CD
MHTDQFGLAGDDYTPDPENDSMAIVDGFFDHIAAGLPDLPDSLIVEMRTRLMELEAANADRVVDEPARYNLRMTLALVVAYRALRPRLDRDEAIALLRAAFVEPLGDIVRESTLAMLDPVVLSVRVTRHVFFTLTGSKSPARSSDLLATQDRQRRHAHSRELRGSSPMIFFRPHAEN